MKSETLFENPVSNLGNGHEWTYMEPGEES